MRLAEPATQAKKLIQLIEQTNRAYRTSVWQFRNAPDSIKADVRVIMGHLKDATDELEALRDRALEIWREADSPAAPPPPVDDKKIAAMTALMPGVAPNDAARVIHLLGEILGAQVTQHK